MSLLLLLALGCSDDDDGAADDSAVGDTSDLCADAPVTTWDNFGAGFLTENCNACHAQNTPERQGAPEDVVFDSVEEVWAWSDRIVARATGETPSMPPQGGVTGDDRYRLEVWFTCADEGT